MAEIDGAKQPCQVVDSRHFKGSRVRHSSLLLSVSARYICMCLYIHMYYSRIMLISTALRTILLRICFLALLFRSFRPSGESDPLASYSPDSVGISTSCCETNAVRVGSMNSKSEETSTMSI